MTHEEALKKYCEISGMVYHTIAEYEYASDGICHECAQKFGGRAFDPTHYRNDGKVIEFIAISCINELKKSGRIIVTDAIWLQELIHGAKRGNFITGIDHPNRDPLDF